MAVRVSAAVKYIGAFLLLFSLCQYVEASLGDRLPDFRECVEVRPQQH